MRSLSARAAVTALAVSLGLGLGAACTKEEAEPPPPAGPARPDAGARPEGANTVPPGASGQGAREGTGEGQANP